MHEEINLAFGPLLEDQAACFEEGWQYVFSEVVCAGMSRGEENQKDYNEHVYRATMFLSAFARVHFNVAIDKRFFRSMVKAAARTAKDDKLPKDALTDIQNNFAMCCSAHLTLAMAMPHDDTVDGDPD